MNPQQIFRRAWTRYALAVALVAFASALRIWPLQSLGSGLAWLTYYPAVMIVAIYGGLSAGLLATVLHVLRSHFCGRSWLLSLLSKILPIGWG